jgi:Protein of unknown function (DUF3109)
MLIIEHLLISDDILEKEFVCNLGKCKGACCVEGESGAPLEEDELAILEKEYPKYESYLSAAGKKVIKKKGFHLYDEEDEKHKTPLIKGGACVYAYTDKEGVVGCGIEQAYLAGKTSFKKPISCHLYPIRVKKMGDMDALNYERWNICKPACSLGNSLGVPVFKFLKEALIRKYGESIYEGIEAAANTQYPDK